MFLLKIFFSMAIFCLRCIVCGYAPLPEYPPSCPNISAIKGEPPCSLVGLYHIVTVSENADYTCLIVNSENEDTGIYPQNITGIFKNGTRFQLYDIFLFKETPRGLANQKSSSFFSKNVGYILYASEYCDIYVEYTCQDIGGGKPEDLVMVYSRFKAPQTELAKKILKQNGLQHIALRDIICPPNFDDR